MITKEKLKRLLALMDFVTPGPWEENSTMDGAEIGTQWHRECDCEADNKTCLFDCTCDEVTTTRETICEFPSRTNRDLPALEQSILDAEFICIVRNLFPELVQDYLKLTGGDETN